MEGSISKSSRLNSLALEQAWKLYAGDFGYYSYDVLSFDKTGKCFSINNCSSTTFKNFVNFYLNKIVISVSFIDLKPFSLG